MLYIDPYCELAVREMNFIQIKNRKEKYFILKGCMNPIVGSTPSKFITKSLYRKSPNWQTQQTFVQGYV